MSVKVSLLIDGIETNVLEYDFTFNQEMDANNRPKAIPKFEGIQIKIESQKALHFAPWAIADNQTKQLQLIISPVTQTGKTRTLHLFDCHLVGWNNHFSSTGTSPKTETLSLTCGGVRENADTLEYSAPWRETFDVPPPESEEEEEEKTVIDSIVWVNADSKEENIKELIYTQNASLKVKIANPTGAAATFVIKKEDGNEFENGDLEIKFTETVEADGTVELKPFTIKTKWEELKVARTDKLIAEVTHNKESKKSDPLELLPSPKVLASFRPENSWKGEFGFDWIRTGDTNLFKDVKFESIISKQYTDATHTTLEMNHNEYGGSFKKDPAQFEKLKKEYKPIEVKWRKVNDATGKKVNDKHCTEWLSLKNGKEAKVKIHIDVTDKADYLEFDSNANFTISPKKIDIKNKKGKKKLKDVVTIKCIKEFAGDQEIIIKAFKEPLKDGVPAGKINVWANNAAKHKQKKVVFVQIKTDLKGKGLLKTANAKPEKPRINQYLEQAYIELHPDSTIIDLDLSADADFAKFVIGGKLRKSIPAVAGKAEVPEVKAVAATATTPAV